MGFFSSRYTREGPGVPKNAPKKKGAARFFEILMRDYGDFWKAGMLLSLSCVPMVLSVVPAVVYPGYLGVMLISAALFLVCSVLVGPALMALHAIVVLAVRDEPFFFWHEYKKAWRENWRQAIPVGVLFSALGGLECMAGWMHLTQRTGKSNVFLLGMVLLGLLLVVTCWLYSILQMLYLALPVRNILKNSLLLTFGYAKRSLPAGLITMVLVAAMILLLPVITVLLALAGVPAIIALIADMWAWPVMDKAFDISAQLEQKKAREEAENGGAT